LLHYITKKRGRFGVIVDRLVWIQDSAKGRLQVLWHYLALGQKSRWFIITLMKSIMTMICGFSLAVARSELVID
tara:strand:- start:26 stop:247 length:222 start_codon:yes stop_codon:yes gene_type:complete